MKIIRNSLVIAGLVALAGCGGAGDDAAGDNVADAAEAQADSLEVAADNTANESAADALENRADEIEDAGERNEAAIDEADIQTNR
jgi:UDP-N-acetylmuramyl tripeptide synthase